MRPSVPANTAEDNSGEESKSRGSARWSGVCRTATVWVVPKSIPSRTLAGEVTP
jgi:hypothetical protein